MNINYYQILESLDVLRKFFLEKDKFNTSFNYLEYSRIIYRNKIISESDYGAVNVYLSRRYILNIGDDFEYSCRLFSDEHFLMTNNPLESMLFIRNIKN